jgi:hypothetical protein
MIILPFGILSDTDHTATEDTVQALIIFFLISLLLLVTDNHVGMSMEFDYTAKRMTAAGFCIYNINIHRCFRT